MHLPWRKNQQRQAPKHNICWSCWWHQKVYAVFSSRVFKVYSQGGCDTDPGNECLSAQLVSLKDPISASVCQGTFVSAGAKKITKRCNSVRLCRSDLSVPSIWQHPAVCPSSVFWCLAASCVSSAAPELISPHCLWGVCSAHRHYLPPRVEVIPLSAQIPSLWTNDEINPAQSSSLLPSTVCLCPGETESAASIKLQGCAGFIKEFTAEVNTSSPDVFQMIKESLYRV